MARVSDFYTFLDTISPFSTQEKWDNSGILIGDELQEVTRAAVVLDITNEAIQYAAQVGAELIISHHPVIFKAQRSFLKGSPAFNLAANSISAICSHTCLDSAIDGVNDVLAQLLGIQDVEILPCEQAASTVRAGVLPEPINCDELAIKIKEILGGNVKYCTNARAIESVALCSGAGAEFASDIIKAGIDAFITSDASHHDFLDCQQAGLALFDAGHFETENPIIPVLANKLRCEFPDTDIIVIPQKSPCKTI